MIGLYYAMRFWRWEWVPHPVLEHTFVCQLTRECLESQRGYKTVWT